MTDTDERVDITLLLVRRWKLIVSFALVATTAATVYAFVAPEWYQATLTVVPSQRAPDSAASTLAARIPGSFDMFQTDVQRIQAVLTSNSVADEVIDKFNLLARYGTQHREHARAALWEHCATSVDRKSSVVSLTCEDQDPKHAMEMAAYFGDIGNKVFGRVSVSSAREERTFLEEQVQKARRDVDESSRKLRDFQEKHKVVDLPEQSKAVISAMASIKGELISKQLELSYLSSFSARTESSVVQLEQQIAIMASKLKQLEESEEQTLRSNATRVAGSGSGHEAESEKADFFPSAMTVPELRFELEQLTREQKIQETVFSLMTQRYEMAKIDEARDTSTFQILDHPTLPTFRSRPNHRRIALMGGTAGLAASLAWILVPVWWRRRRIAM